MKRFVFILLIVLLPAMPVFGQTEKKGETVNV